MTGLSTLSFDSLFDSSVKRKSTTAKSKMNTKEFDELKSQFLSDVKATVDMEEIPVELILNWPQPDRDSNCSVFNVGWG